MADLNLPDGRTPVLLSSCRTPIGSFGGALKALSAADLGAVVVREAIRRAGIDGAAIDDVVLGCVLQAGGGMNIARQAALRAGLPAGSPAETINRVCGSGLQAVIHAADAIRAGSADVIVAGGAESMSNASYLLKQARWGHRMGHGEVVDSMLSEGLTCAINSCHMGMTAEEVARRFNVTRAEQDAFAAESQRRAAAAIAAEAFRGEIVAVDISDRKNPDAHFDTDEYPRATSPEKLTALRPAFSKDGTVTAGNASGINDGAAAVIVSSLEYAARLNLKPVARILGYAIAGVDPMIMGMGPVPAVRKALERARLTLPQVDLFELNEAFAAQALAVSRELGVDAEKVNVRGGAIAIGHPIGASGARILTTLVHALDAEQRRYGVAALCIGGGMGIAMVIEAA